MKPPVKSLPLPEFVALLAMMTSILALSTDAILPAFETISTDFALDNPNDAQLMVSAMFLGFAFGQIIMGPLSDSFGRKPVIYGSYVVFLLGCLITIFGHNYTYVLIGRVLQGLGAAGPRIVGIALVRDLYSGRTMARIMSIIMAIFILVPAIAPALGQGILLFAHWRMIFVLLFISAFIAFIWLAVRQPETLEMENRNAFSLSSIWSKMRLAFSYKTLVGYTLASGALFGAFLGYLNSAQQVFQTSYDKGPWFAVYFGVAALAIGASSIYNSKVVERLGMRFLSKYALVVLTLTGIVTVLLSLFYDGVPPFMAFMIWLLITFACMGILFGNINALAMEPVGHMAGLGAAIIGSVSTLISLPFGWAIGAMYNGTVIPLVGGFALLGAVTFALFIWTESKQGIE